MLNPGGQLPLRTLKAVGVRSCGFALFLRACAITNTPQQDLAYARWAKCNAPYISLEWVDLDGRITFRFSTEGGDRKSTRLNSSHLVISYAVFCLKKKHLRTRDELYRRHRAQRSKL